MLHEYRTRLAEKGVVTLTMRARPNARVTKIVAILDDRSAKIDVKAIPEDGRANEEIVRFLAEEFDVPLSCVTVLLGHRGRAKVVKIAL